MPKFCENYDYFRLYVVFWYYSWCVRRSARGHMKSTETLHSLPYLVRLQLITAVSLPHKKFLLEVKTQTNAIPDTYVYCIIYVPTCWLML